MVFINSYFFVLLFLAVVGTNITKIHIITSAKTNSTCFLSIFILMVAVLVLVAIEVSRFAPSPSVLSKGTIREIEEIEESRVFAVLTAEIGTEPARSVIFKPRYPGMTIVWFEKIKN